MADVRTFRPPSSPELEPLELPKLVGQVMAAVARVEKTQQQLEARWRSESQEHETMGRELTQLGRTVRELEPFIAELQASTTKTHKSVRLASRLAPLAFVLVEVAKQVISHYLPGVFS